MISNVTGLLASALIHGSLVLLIFYGFSTKPTLEKKEKEVPLRLAMFQKVEAVKDPVPTPQIIKKKRVEKKPPRKAKIKKAVVKRKKAKPQKKPAKKNKVKKHSSQKTSIQKSAFIPKPAPKKQHITPSKTQKNTVQKPIKNKHNKAAERQYKSRLHNLITQHKKYPSRAKRKQEEGTVTVSFIIYANGSIQKLKIVRSSGSDTLDRAAINTVKKISNRLPFPAEISRKQWAFTLPLVYRLR